MADILIRGISIPRNCFECPLFTNCDACEGHECGCGLLGGIGYEEDISEDRRRDDCLLHELPEHGDLIDKSELLDNSKVNGMYPHWIDTMDVKRAPVIVPSNKEETDG